MKELLELKITGLRKLAKEYEIPNFSSMTKAELINYVAIEQKGRTSSKIKIEAKPKDDLSEDPAGTIYYGMGKVDIMTDGYGFLRSTTIGSDAYVSNSQIKKFGLRNGDIVCGELRAPMGKEKNYALIKVDFINGDLPEKSRDRPYFDDLIPSYPDEKLNLGSASLSSRIIDLMSPIGKGQRGLIVAPPKAGKTILLSTLANDIIKNNPETEVWILLIDERPEEVTDFKESIEGKNVEVIYSTFDELPEHHKRVSEMVLERAKRLVEHKEDVVILLDSITRLARAYNLTVPPSGRTLTGGLDPAALYMPKKFFGAARNMREGGSLTILATALVETGSKMDDVIFEEFKGTGNMELVLNRKLAEKRIFPAVDIAKSGTRREELLLTKDEREVVTALHKELSGNRSEEFMEQMLDLFKRTKDNKEFVALTKRSLLRK